MAKPYRHALSSAKKFGGSPDDYIDIHNLMDSSKSAIGDNRHRALTHNAWFVGSIVELIFGVSRTNSAGRVYCVRDIAEQHVLEDFGHKYIPSAQDYLEHMDFKDWMQNGLGQSGPSSVKKLNQHRMGAQNGSSTDESGN